MRREPITLVLVHGGLHGSWCFGPLTEQLHRLGIRSVAVDLPIDDPDLGADAYADVVARRAADLGPVTLVGHSMGGLVVPVAASRLETVSMIFVCAMLPLPGRSLASQYESEPSIIGEAQPAFSFDEDDRLVLAPEDARRILYHDCSDEVATWAADRLAPQASHIVLEPCPLTAWPDIPSSYIMGTEDRAVPAEWVRKAVPERLGVDPIELPGGHSPFLARPAELAAVLGDLLPRGASGADRQV